MNVFDSVEPVAEHLRRGGMAVIPTDTVYGIAAPLEQQAVDAMFEIKQRPRAKALPLLGAAAQDLLEFVDFDERAYKLAERHWPGPLTLVLPRAERFELDLGGDGRGVAVRVPAFPLTLSLLEVTGPLAVTSANASGAPPATNLEEATAALADARIVYLDGGETPSGEPSMVLSLLGDEPVVLRPGKLGDPWAGGSLEFRL